MAAVEESVPSSEVVGLVSDVKLFNRWNYSEINVLLLSLSKILFLFLFSPYAMCIFNSLITRMFLILCGLILL
ncbi:hypothetical protein Lalb_Chr15g0085421 [Lupinus albus]|uniref:Uncharacterized protein n=1 Tax=Lupinus albus TaxID=3870 RepID=A0A6A4P7I7_LUPAL|nr:hypothetical protein Lalb_Chr15g0085421 [Lupinus albus]